MNYCKFYITSVSNSITVMEMTDPDERIHEWSDEVIMNELGKLTGDFERDIEREAMRRIMMNLTKIKHVETTRS